MNIADRILNKFWRSIFLPKAKIHLNQKHYAVPRLLKNNFYKATYNSESWFVELLRKIHQKNPINNFLDVGVNIGQTLLKIKAINKDVIYYGFEPNPVCCSITQQIISVNKFSNCNIIPCGLSDKQELLKLSLSDENNVTDSAATIIQNFREQEFNYYKYVAVFRLDDLISQLSIKTIDVIKIDVEGAELEAVKGMQRTLNKYFPILIMEVLPSYDSNNKFRIRRQKELSTVLIKLGYRIFHIENRDIGLAIREVYDFPIHKNVCESDYILLPKHINVMDLGINIIG